MYVYCTGFEPYKTLGPGSNCRSSCKVFLTMALKRAGSSDLAVMQGSGYYQRDKTRWRTLYWTVREIIQRKLAIIPWHSFAASNSEGKIIFSHVCFVQFFPREQISVLNIVPPP